MIGISKLYCGTVEPSDALRYGRQSQQLPSHLLQFSSDKKPVVVWNVTRRCNLKCVHCYAHATGEASKDELTTEEGKVLIDDLMKHSTKDQKEAADQPDMFADFNGLPDDNARTEFYHHDANWSNRMILGDSLQVMASLAEREGLRGKVQCIYIDPPYGIKFNSNFQWSTTSRDVKDGKFEHITREPEQVKALIAYLKTL